jgi:hypothetical protein
MRMIKRAIRRLADFCLKQQEQHYDLHASSPASQKSLLLQYAAATASFTMDNAAFKVFSQSKHENRIY